MLCLVPPIAGFNRDNSLVDYCKYQLFGREVHTKSKPFDYRLTIVYLFFMKKQLIEYQCFRKLLIEVFRLGKVYRDAKGVYKTHELEDFAERIGVVGKGKIGRQTLVDHWKRTEIPSISKLNLYCRYCKEMKSEWCQVNTWAKLYRQYKEEEGLVEDIEITDKEKFVEDGDITDGEEEVIEEKIYGKEEKKVPPKRSLLITNVWYTSEEYSFWNFWRKTDEGVVKLDYNKKEIYFSSDKTEALTIRAMNVQNFFQAKMPGDISHSWVKIIYTDSTKLDTSGNKEAWFQPQPPKGTRGIANWVGGGGDFYKAIYDLIHDIDDDNNDDDE